MVALIQGPARIRAFTVRALQRAEADDHGWWERTLGVRWDSATIHKLAKTIQAKRGNELTEDDKIAQAASWHRGVLIPLSMLISPHDFIDHLSKQAPLPGQVGRAMPVALGDYAPGPDEEIISLGSATKATFFSVLSIAGIYPGARPAAPKGAQVDSERAAKRHAESTPLHQGTKREFQDNMGTGLPEYDPAGSRPRRKGPKK